jgi:formate dehydrogenase subunit delta
MNIQHLVTMANDISAFFDSEMGVKEAPQGVALHISRYWDPRMRSQIIHHAAAGGESMSATALAAVRSLPPAPDRNQ